MVIEKPSRYESKKNLELIKSLPCFICGNRPTDPDHFKTKGSGGGDNISNLNAFCRIHHIERHGLGIKTFWVRYGMKIIDARDRYDLPKLDIGSILE